LLVYPAAAAGVALFAKQRGWGLLNAVDWPIWAEAAVAVVVLDFVVYLQHVMFHAIPALWRLHMVHHADLDLDASSGVRFHPGEIVISLGIKASAIVALGAPPLAVLIFEVVLNATSIFNHSNLYLPLGLDRVLRLIVVTPDMHRVHHSTVVRESNHNFGFNLPWWDRLLGTYQPQPGAGHEGMDIGLSQFREERRQGLWGLLAMPATGRPGAYPLSRKPQKDQAPAQAE
jgi:sterol desaturase/sphingolipid hydroxylase (fatty acid hydroxylase superfamily)